MLRGGSREDMSAARSDGRTPAYLAERMRAGGEAPCVLLHTEQAREPRFAGRPRTGTDARVPMRREAACWEADGPVSADPSRAYLRKQVGRRSPFDRQRQRSVKRGREAGFPRLRRRQGTHRLQGGSAPALNPPFRPSGRAKREGVTPGLLARTHCEKRPHMHGGCSGG